MLLETLDPAGAHCADFPLYISIYIHIYIPLSPPSSAFLRRNTSIVRGCSKGASRAGRKRILKQGGNCLSFSRAEIFLPPRVKFLAWVRCSGEKGEIVGCIAGCVVRVMSGINLGLIIKMTESLCAKTSVDSLQKNDFPHPQFHSFRAHFTCYIICILKN